MIGLEPPGTLPEAKRFTGRNLDAALAELRETVYSELHRSFFITRQMDRQFRGQVTDGLFPPILHLLVRTGHQIVGYRYVRLNEDGNVVKRAPGEPAPSRNKGIQVDFRTEGRRQVQRLFYFSANLSDKSLKDNQALLGLMAKQKGVSTFFKATSYMTHHADFSIVRDRVLEISGAVLQDDSGIPFRFFQDPAWRVQLFGEYDKPYGSFRWLEQPALRQAYSATGKKPLGFRIGYGYSRIPSNLLFAERAR